MICPYCRETIQDEAIKCRYCGSMLNPTQYGPTQSGDYPASNGEVRAFVGNNAEYYARDFARFTVTGTDQFTLTWNWSAFCFTFIWMLYRKMYWQALVTFVISCMPGINILLHLGVGCISNYMYFKDAQVKIQEARQRVAPQNLYATLQQIGGVHRWAITVGIVITAVLILVFSLFFAAISTFILNVIQLGK